LTDHIIMNALASKTLKTPADLAAAGLISEADVEAVAAVSMRYATAIPAPLARLIAREGGAIARQFVPDARELNVAPQERADPIGDHSHSPVKGIVHRYPDRVLLMPTLTCAVYCRFCFRREIVGGEGALTPAEMAAALAYIAATPAIWEVILTGGDPLVLSPRRIGEIIAALDAIPHVKVIRIHSRVPIAMPERIDAALIAALKRTSKAVFIGIHCNHAAELTDDVVAGCARLADAGFALLSQSVLLRGVNDTAEALETLFRALVAARIKPYYLHQLDYAPGTSHFRVPVDEGLALVQSLRGRLSGLAHPVYILDIPDGAGKVPINDGYISPEGDGTYIVRDPAGGQHAYPPSLLSGENSSAPAKAPG
jgi:lysine 2,3-aminomutase